MEVDYMAINFRDEQFCNASVQQDRKIAMVQSQMDPKERMLVKSFCFDFKFTFYLIPSENFTHCHIFTNISLQITLSLKELL